MECLMAVILAAGEGKRMKSKKAKVVHEIQGILSTGYRLTETPVFATWLSSLPTEKQTMKILSRRILTIPLSNPP